jgi:hypothetical protein
VNAAWEELCGYSCVEVIGRAGLAVLQVCALSLPPFAGLFFCNTLSCSFATPVQITQCDVVCWHHHCVAAYMATVHFSKKTQKLHPY